MLIETLKKGFTLVELVVALAILSILFGTAIPTFRSMHQEGQLTKAEGDLETLKTAIFAFWRNNSFTYPGNIHGALTSGSPAVITKVLPDPWNTDAVNKTYGYAKATDATFGNYFFVYTKGPRANTAPAWDAVNQRVNYTGSGRVISNAPIQKN